MTEDFIFKQKIQKLDLSEIDKKILNVSIDKDISSPVFILRRVLGIREILDYSKSSIDKIENGNFLQEIVSNMKADYLLLDTKLLLDLGFKELWFKELVPGNTSIAYEISTEER